MRIVLLLTVLVWSGFCGHAVEFTNTLAIYLVAEEIPRELIFKGAASPKELKLKPEPIISDADWVTYHTNDHRFVLTKAVATRVATATRNQLQTPFVLVAGGERVYVGIFTSSLSSFSSRLPSIVVSTGHPDTTEVELGIDKGYPPPSGFGNGPDRRGDGRITAAAARLFGSSGTRQQR